MIFLKINKVHHFYVLFNWSWIYWTILNLNVTEITGELEYFAIQYWYPAQSNEATQI